MKICPQYLATTWIEYFLQHFHLLNTSSEAGQFLSEEDTKMIPMLEGVHSLITLGMGNLRDIIYTLEIAPAIEKSPVNGYGSPPNPVIQRGEICCLDLGTISP